MFEIAKNIRQYKKLPREQKQLVIYSEGRQYWRFFAPIVRQLASSYEHKICYVSSDKQDPGLDQTNTIGIYIGEKLGRTFWFYNLQATVVLMTMPDLQNSHLKRSFYPVHYAYLFHSLVSSHCNYLQHAFDHYDSILCAGEHHIREIRQTEKLNHLKPKKLIPCGYPLLDDLVEQAKQHPSIKPLDTSNQSFTILYAPSWGEQLSLNQHGENIISLLISHGNKVIFRPHPHSLKTVPQLIARIKKTHGNSTRFKFQLDAQNTQDLFTADALITDWSGIGFEFAFVVKKPILFIDTPRKARNPSYQKIGVETFEAHYRHHFGQIIDPQRLDTINHTLQQLILSFEPSDDSLISKQLFNLGNSTKKSAQALVELIRCVRNKENPQT